MGCAGRPWIVPLRTARGLPVRAHRGDCAQGGEPVRIQGWLELEGWLAADTLAGVVPDSVWLTLDRPGEPTQVGRLDRVSRPDVATYFGKPGLTRSGFRGVIYLPALEGSYQLGLVYLLDGRWYRMAGVQQPIRFSRLE